MLTGLIGTTGTGKRTITIAAANSLTFSANIILSVSDVDELTLSANGSIGDSANVREITAAALTLEQTDAFGSDREFVFTNEAMDLTLTTSGAGATETDPAQQAIQDWMSMSGKTTDTSLTGSFNLTCTNCPIIVGGNLGRDPGSINLDGSEIQLTADVVLSATRVAITGNIISDDPLAARALTISTAETTAANSITIDGDIDTSGGALTLMTASSHAQDIQIIGDDRELTGGVIMITGGITREATINHLRITAVGNLTVGDIDINDGVLRLAAMATSDSDTTSAIDFGATSTRILASRVILAQAADFTGDANTPPAMFLLYSAPSELLFASGNLIAAAAWADNTTPLDNNGEGRFIAESAFEFAATDFPAGLLRGIDSITLDAGSGAITFAAAIPTAITFQADRVLITAGSIDLAGRTLTIITDSGALTLNGGVNIMSSMMDAGGLVLNLAGGITSTDDTVATVILPSVTITQAGTFGSTAPLTLVGADGASTVGSLTLNTEAAQTVYSWMIADGRTVSLTSAVDVTVATSLNNGGEGDFTLISMGGVVAINANITIGGALDLNGSTGITISGTRILSAGSIDLLSEVTASTDSANLTVIATGDITLSNNINVGAAGSLVLTAGDTATTGNISNSGATRTLTAGTIALTQDGVFADDLFTLASASALVLETEAAQRIYNWMAQTGTSLTLTSAAEIVIRGNITLGTGDLTLRGAAINILGLAANARTVSGGNISLTATGADGVRLGTFADTPIADTFTAETGSDPVFALTIEAAGALTLNNSLSIRGILTLSANEGSISSVADPTLTALAISLTQGVPFVPDFPFDLTSTDVTIILANGVEEQMIDVRYDWLIVAGRDLKIYMDDAGAVLRIVSDIDLGATGRLTLLRATATTGLIEFSGVRTITAGQITLNRPAESDFGLILGGAMTTMLEVGNIQLSELSSVLTLRVSTGAIAVKAGATPILRAGEIRLTQTDAFAAGIFEIHAASRALILSTEAAQTVHAWMLADGLGLSLTSAVSITLSNNIMGGEQGIALVAPTITLSGSQITLSGATVHLSANTITGQNLIIEATAGDITTADRDADDADSNIPALTATSLSLTQNGVFGSAVLFEGLAVAALTSLTLETSADQPVEAWMIDTTNGRALTLTCNGCAITSTSDIATGSGSLTLSATEINIGGAAAAARMLSGGDVRLALSGANGVRIGSFDNDGDFTAGDFALTLMASGTLRVNSDVETGSGALMLTGTSGIVLDGEDAALGGGAITLTGVTTTTTNTNLTITAQGDVTINNNINIGSGALVIAAGRATGDAGTGSILWADGATDDDGQPLDPSVSPTTPRIVITAASVSLTQDGSIFPVSRPATFTLPSGALPQIVFDGAEVQPVVSDWYDIFYARDIEAAYAQTTRGNTLRVTFATIRSAQSITLSSRRTILFRGSGPIVLRAPVITITTRTLSLGNRSLTVIAAGGTLTLNANIVGINDVFLSAQTIVFAGNATRSVTGDDVTFISSNPVTSIRNVVLTAYRNLTVAASLSLEDDNLTLIAGQDRRVNRRTTITTTGALIFEGASTIRANAITLRADTAPPSGSDVTLVLEATGNISVGVEGINVGAGGALTLLAGSGSTTGNIILLTGTTAPMLTADSVSLTQDGAFADNLFTLAAVTTSPAARTRTVNELELVTGAAQTIYDWMSEDGLSLTLTSAAAIAIDSDIALGTGNLILTGTEVNIVGAAAAARILSGGNIVMTPSGTNSVRIGAFDNSGDFTAGDFALTLTALGTLTLNSDVEVGTGALMITGTVGIVLGRQRVILDGGDIVLTGAITTTMNTDLTVEASGDLTVAGDIDLGDVNSVGASASDGGLVLTAGDGAMTGTITFSGTRAFIARFIRLEQDATPFTPSTPPVGVTFMIDGGAQPQVYDGTTTSDGVWFTVGRKTNEVFVPGDGDTVLTIDLSGRSNSTIQASRSIVLDAGALNIEFAGGGTGETIVLEAPEISIIAGMVMLDGRGLEIRAAGGAVTLNANLVGLNTAANITLMAAEILSDGASVMATGNLVIAADFDVANDLELAAGMALIFSGDRRLSAGEITLTAAVAPDLQVAGEVNNANLTLIARGDINIGTAINIGTGVLTLTAGEGAAGNIVNGFATGVPTITALRVALSQDGVFGMTAPLGLPQTGSLSLTSRASSDQTVHNTWMVVAGRSLAVNSGRNIRITTATNNFGLGSFTASASGTIVFTNAATEILAADITLTTGSRGGISTNRRAVTLTATGNILLNTSIGLDSRGRLDARAGNLTLAAVGGIDFDAQRSITLNGGVVRLTAGAVDLASDNMGTAVIRARGGLTLTGSFGTGEGNLSLIAGGALNFGGGTASDTTSRNGAVVLSGSVITLTGGANPTASNQALTVTATGNLTINTNIDTGAAGDLTLASGGALQFRTNRATQLSGDNIMLTSSSLPRAGRQSLTVSAQRDLVVNASLHTGASTSRSRAGVLTLRAGVASSVGVGGLSFATSAPVELTGRNIIFESDGDASVSMAGSHNLTIRAFTNLEISSDLRLGSMSGDEMSSVLSLRARTIEVAGDRVMAADQIIVRQDGSLFTDQQPASFVSGELRVIATGNQRYYAWMGSVADRSLWLESRSGNIILDAAIDLGAGSLTLRAASRRRLIILETAADRFVGADITLVSSGTITTGGRDLTIAATGDLRIDASVNAGTGQVALSGATLVFGGATRVVNGGEIMLTGRGAPASASNRSLTVRARNDLTVLGHLNAGTGSLTLIGGLNTRVGRTTQVNAGSLYLGVSSAGDSVETVLNGLNIVLIGDAGGTSRASTESVSVVARRGLSVSTDILTSGDLVLSAGAGLGSRDMGVLQLRRDAATRLTGAMIELSADPRRGALPAASNQDLTVEASGDLTLAAHLNAGTGDVVLTAGGTILLSTARDVEVRGDDVQLQGGAASPASGRRLRVIALGDIEVGVDLDTGTGDLVLTAGTGTTRVGRRRVGNIGVINFAGARLLTGDVITLTGDTVRDEAGAVEMPSASDALLRVVALRGLRVNTHMNAGSGNLMLEAGAGTGTRETGVLSFGSGAVLSGADIILTSDGALPGRGSNGNLTIVASGTMTLSANLNLGRGTLDLSAGSNTIEGSNTVLSVGTLRLRQAAGFGASNPFMNIRLNTGGVEFISASSASQTLHEWMVSLVSDRRTSRRRHLTVRTGGDLVVDRDVVLGGRDLVLVAGDGSTTGALNFMAATGETRRLEGNNVNLLSDKGAATPAAGINNFDITIRALSGDLTIGARVNAGAGDLTLSASARRRTGRIMWSSDQASSLSGAAISLTSSRDLLDQPSGQDLTVTGTGAVSIATSIDVGAGNLMVSTTGGAISFGRSRTTSLRGTNIALTSNVTTIAEASAEAGSGRSLTITALGTLQVSAALNLVRRVSRRSVLRGNLVLTAGIGEVLSSSAPGSSLSAGRISLAQASVFVTSNRFGVVTLPSGGTLELVSTSSSALVVQPWMVSAVSAQHLIIRAVGDVNVGVSIELASARNLTLEAGMGDGSGAINFTGSSALTLIGNDVSLTAGLAVDGGVKAPAPFGQDLTITAGGNLLVHADIDAGAGALSLTAGTATRSARSGQIRFSPDRLVTLTGSALELTADRRPSVEGRGVGLRRATVWEEAVASDPFNVATNVGQLEFITTATAAQAVQAWMVSRANSSGSALAVRGAGDVVVANDLIYGRGLILEAGYNGGTGAITFGTVDADMVRALEGSEVTLLSTRASSPSGFALRIRARGDLTVGADLTGDGALTLEAGFGTRRVRVRGRTRSVANDGALTLTGARTLSGSSVTLTGDLAPEQSAGVVSITALTGDVNVNSDINAGSNNISLTASAGAINFNSSRLTVLTGGALSLTATSSPAASSGQTLRLVSSSVWAAASATNPFKTTTTTSVGQIEFVTTSTSDQTVHDWMVTLATSSGDAGLGVRARGNVVVGSSLALGAGDLTLEAGRGTMAMMMTNEMGEQVEVQVRNPGLINFTGPAPLVLSGGDIILDAHGAVSSPFGQNLTITAQGDLEVNADISTSGVLGLTAGASTVAGETGELRFDGQGSRAVVLRANSFMVAGDGVSNVMSGLGLRLISMLPFEAANFTNFEPNVAELEFNALSSSSQPVGAWMVVSGARLVVRASGDLSVSGNLVLVSTDLRGLRSNGRSLILEAGYDVPDSGTSNSGTINFIETVELDAETIMLFGDGPTATGLAGDVVVRTSFDLTIGAHLNSGTGNLRLEAGFGTRRARVGRRTRTLANNGDVVLTGTRTLGGAGINLLGNAVMAEALTVEASGDLTIGTNIEATGDLVLTADRVRFSGSRTLRGENISLRSTGDLETHRRRENVTVRARGNLTLNGPLTSGRGNLTLEAGASETVETMMDGMAVTNVEENFGVITVGTALATELRGVSVVLTADEFGSDGTTRLEPSVGTLAVLIIATGNLTVGTSLLTAGDLTLTASGSRSELRFSSTRSIDLSGAEVSMTSRRAPRRGSDQAVRVVSSGDLMVRALLNVGSGSVSFTAAGALDFPTRTRRGVTTPTLSITAGELSFSQGEVFDGTVPVIFRGGLTGLAVNYSGAGMQEVEGWMVRSGIDVEIVSSGVLVIGRNIDTGTGNLTLSAAGGLSFTGTSGERFVRGNDIIVTSDSDSSGSEVVMSSVNLRIEGRGDVTINDAITVSGASSELRITAGFDVTRTVRGRSVTEFGSGGISATGSPALTAGSIFLDQTEDFAVEDSFVLSSTAAVSITTRRSSLLTVRDWMIALNRDLSLSTEVFGDIIFASSSSVGTASYNFGTGSLTLAASGATRFTFTDASVVNGSVMVDAMMIEVNGNIEAGVHNLELDASGALDFSADVVRLSARMLTLEAGSSSAVNLFVVATSGLSLSTSLTASGILGIDTGGAVPMFNGGATLSATSFDIDFHCMTQCSITTP